MTFSRSPVGIDNLVPLTINWLATPFVSDVILQAIPLSSNSRPYAWTEKQTGFVGTQSAPLGLSSGRWQLCIRPKTVFTSKRVCDWPFWVTICPNKAGTLGSELKTGTTGSVRFYGSQVGVAVESAYGTATFNVDSALSTYRKVTFNVWDLFQNRERFFAYWAWNLGESWHSLNVYAPTTPYGSPVAQHFVAVVAISSLEPSPPCR